MDLKNLNLNWLAIGGALVLILCSSIIGTGLSNINQPPKKISVTGSAQRVIESDVVDWNVKLSRQVDLNKLSDGYTQMNNDLKKINDFLKSSKVSEDELSKSPINVSKEQLETTDDKGMVVKKYYYILSVTYSIESRDINKISKAVDDSANLIKAGIPLESVGLEYYYSKLAGLKLEMLTEATKNAQERAEQVSSAAGSGLAGLDSADMGVFQLTRVNSTDISDYGSYDTSSFKKQITATVHTTFRLR
jgi:hypothetical protein